MTRERGPDDLRAWKQGATGATYFRYSNMNQPVREFNASGALTATNTFGYDGLVSRRAGSASVFYTFDPQGNVAQRLNASGGIVSSDTGDAFGSRATTGSGDVFWYIGQWGYYSDSETGLCLCQHRYYDPATGRFVTRDPMGYTGGINLYNYCQNDCVSCVDVTGYIGEIGAGIADGFAACFIGVAGDIIGRGGADLCATVGTCAGAALVTYLDITNPEIVSNPVTECISNAVGAVFSNAVTAACNYLQDQCCYKPNWPCILATTFEQAAIGCVQGVINYKGSGAGDGVRFAVDRLFDTLGGFIGAKIDTNCSGG